MLDQRATIGAEVEALHRRCGVYTRGPVVRTLLDAVGWTSSSDLTDKRLLEPAAGDGAFLVETATRLLDSMTARGAAIEAAALVGHITAFELHPVEADHARSRLADILVEYGLSATAAWSVVEDWVRNDDFLLADLQPGTFTHVVGNPPYSRWSRIPATLRTRYEAVLPRRVTRGDLFLPFLDLGIGALQEGGRLGFVCSDRWRYTAFAEGFRRSRLPEVEIELDEPIAPAEAYERNVDVYPSLLVMRRTLPEEPPLPRQGVTLAEAGFRVRVGPALGVTKAFVVEAGDNSVEEELLAPWVDGSEIQEGELTYRGRKVIVIHDHNGRLRNLDEYPRAKARLDLFRSQLEGRAIVKKGAVWYRPIDRVVAAEWRRPKLLIPELAKIPCVVLDKSGAIPSHGVYAIFAPGDDLAMIYERLGHGGLFEQLRFLAPRAKGQYYRCYKRFLDQVSV